jgi:hypothetical protein
MCSVSFLQLQFSIAPVDSVRTMLHAAGMMMHDAEFFSTLDEHQDLRAGEWPAKVVSGLAAAAASCTEFRPRNRAKVKDVLPKLTALSRRGL